jgi:hypothetical protein
VINLFPPGGAVDVVSARSRQYRPMVQKPVVIDTKAGAAGQVGARVAANAKPDGYTLPSIDLDLRLCRVDWLFGRQPKFAMRISFRSCATSLILRPL